LPPVDTSTKSTPWACSIGTNAMLSSTLQPPSTHSVAEMRTISGLPAGHTARTASQTSSSRRVRPVKSPPYSSVRWFVSGDMNSFSR